MSRITYDAERIIYTRIKGSSLESAITGEICKMNRPDDSDKEDIVINCPTIGGSETQLSVVNVNIYVNDVRVPNSENHWQPDTARMKVLGKLARDLLEEVHGTDEGNDYHYYIGSQSTFAEPDIKQTYMNFRIEFIFYPV